MTTFYVTPDADTRKFNLSMIACYFFGLGIMAAMESLSRDLFASGLREKHSMERLAAYLFHELRNDQTAQTGVLDIVAEHAHRLPKDVAALVGEARAHAQHANHVITNMVNVTKLNAGKLKLEPVPFCVRKMLDECMLLVRHLLRAKPDVELRLEADTISSTLTALGPADSLRQVLLNLLTNAIKNTTRGHISLRARLEPVADPSEEPLPAAATTEDVELVPLSQKSPRLSSMTFEVEDTGVGIPPDVLSRIFEIEGVQPGTGWGLPLSKQLLELMGAALAVQTTTSAGSLFSFTVRQQTSESSPVAPAANTTSGTPAAPWALPSGLNVLVADDQQICRFLLIRTLQELLPDASFVEAATPEMALAEMRRGDIDLALIDGTFGIDATMDGSDVARIIRHEREQRLAEESMSPLTLVKVTATTFGVFEAALSDSSTRVAPYFDTELSKPLPPIEQITKELAAALAKQQAAASSIDDNC